MNSRTERDLTSIPMVSVVVPCLNRREYLGSTLESILQQDYPHIQCIVIDGGSTDGTVDLLKSCDGRIKWISEPDGGQADAINKGWRMSTGEILAWLNADDLWMVPGSVSQAVAYMQQQPDADVVYGDCVGIDSHGVKKGISYSHEWDLSYAVEHCDHCIPQPASFIRRRTLDKAGWLDTSFRQKMDHEFWLRVGLRGEIRHIPHVLAYARSLPDDTSHHPDTAHACVRVTESFFQLPDVPDSLRNKRRRALSNSYIRGMHYALKAGPDWKTIATYTFKAAVADPRNTVRVSGQLGTIVRVAIGQHPRMRWVRTSLKIVKRSAKLPARLRRKLQRPPPPVIPNLWGDRDVEWSWVAAHMPSGPGEALDFGAGGSSLALIAAQRGFQVTALDLQPSECPYTHPDLHFVQGDLSELSLRKGQFDLVINCSTVEHVGLAGRYGVTENRPDGDLEAMTTLRALLKPAGLMLLVVPTGRDAVFEPLTRVYGAHRLPRLLTGFDVEGEAFWVKDSHNRWVSSERAEALAVEASAGSWNALRNVYALACFVLRRPVEIWTEGPGEANAR